jgi:membrane peptidoglycan carboxypeptidase
MAACPGELHLSATDGAHTGLQFVFRRHGTSWGVEIAARGYFGKSAKELTLEEGGLLAGLTKGPNYFSPDRQPARAQERLAYVLTRMREDGMLGSPERNAAECP